MKLPCILSNVFSFCIIFMLTSYCFLQILQIEFLRNLSKTPHSAQNYLCFLCNITKHEQANKLKFGRIVTNNILSEVQVFIKIWWFKLESQEAKSGKALKFFFSKCDNNHKKYLVAKFKRPNSTFILGGCLVTFFYAFQTSF